MLDPHERTLLLDALRPPEGFRFDEAIATTYSLDLVALLAAPLGFSLTAVTGNPSADWDSDTALTILRALRRHAARMSVFCDGARLAMPRVRTPLYTLLEPAIVPAKAPADGAAFHPKMWALRFEPDGLDARPRYRVLVLTRNLTFDRSLDLVAVLEGELRSSDTRVRLSGPIAKFIAALGPMAIGTVGGEHARRLARFATEIGRTELRPQAPFDHDLFDFFSFGHPGGTREIPTLDATRRRLVMSPFVSSKTLEKLSDGVAEAMLFSRLSSLDAVPTTSLEGYEKVFIPRQELQDFDPDERTNEPEKSAVRAADLHAKLYIEEYGRGNVRWLMGSANATDAAFHRNVEILLGLYGNRKDVGIDVLLADAKSRTDFLDLWQPYKRSDEAADNKVDDVEAELDRTQAALGALAWEAHVQRTGEDRFTLELRCADGLRAAVPPKVSLRLWPLLLGADQSKSPLAADALLWPEVALASLSAFFGAELTMEQNGRRGATTMLLFAPLHGAPEGRAEAVTRYLLKDQAAVVRFLHLLLDTSDDHVALPEDSDANAQANPTTEPSDVTVAGLLESMLRALEARPERVDEAGRVIRDLAATEEGRSRLPDGLLEVWGAIETARRELTT